MSPYDSKERLRLVIDAAPIAMIVVDRTGRIVLANRQMAEAFGYTTTELLGRGVDLLVPESSRRLHHLQVSSFIEAAVPRVMGIGREVYGIHKDGHQFPVEIGLTPIATDDGPQAVAAIIDITERKRIETESTLARIVQEAMLPQSQPGFAGCDIWGVSKPADATGGDFFDYIPLPDDRLGVVIGDASGHGFAAALVTAAARSYLRALSMSQIDISQILATANRLLIEDVSDGRFVTLFYVVLDPGRSLLTYAGAGHTGYLLGHNGKLKEQLATTGPPLGWFPDAEYPTTTIRTEAGDILLLLTDGIEEAMSSTHELFGRERVLKTVQEHSRDPAASIVRALYDAVGRFRAQQHDDATTIVVKFESTAGPA